MRILLNPIVVSCLVVALLTAGWMAHVSGPPSLAQARPGANLLAGFQPMTSDTRAPLDPSADGAFGGWHVASHGDAQTSLELIDGQLSDKALQLGISQYTSGDVTLTSPRVEVEPGRTYLFKAFTTSDADFTLLTRQHHADGSTTLKQLRNPLERPGNLPFTVSDAFHSGDTITAVEYVLRLASTGVLRVEDAYLEAAEDVLLPPAVVTEPNLIPAFGFTGPQPGGASSSWSPYSFGALTMESGRDEDEDGTFLWTRITNYQDGEAKWQYEPVPVTADQYFDFSATYRSDLEVDVLAEFELEGGGREFRNLSTVPPAGEWTTIGASFQVPLGARTVMVTLVSHGDGTTYVRNQTLSDATTPGPLRWDRPMVSITFDDGWESVYDRAVPLLDEHGFPSTQYVNASTIETPNFMTAAEIRQMHEAGHEIAAHSYRHVDLTSIDADRLEEELRKSRDVLAGAGLETSDLAPPFGRSDSQVNWYASQYFDTVRGTDGGINTRQNIDPLDLKVFYVTDETTPDSLAQALDETSRMNGWLILVYHQIAASESTATQKSTIVADQSTITSDAFAAQLQTVKDSGIEVQPVAEAFTILQGQ
jgi:peptidoglycan/xylan/chitin deacetylase (PgdA/CDA1 family)